MSRGKKLAEKTWVKIVEGYMKTRAIKGAAEYAGVAENTAAKYIKEGDPDHGRPPIREMYEAARGKALDKFVGDMTEEIGNTLKVLKGVQDAGFGTLLKQLRDGRKKTTTRREGAREVVFETTEDVSIAPRSVIAAARELQRLLGGADKVVEIRVVEVADVMIQSMQKHTHAALVEYGVPLDTISAITRKIGEDVRRAAGPTEDGTVH